MKKVVITVGLGCMFLLISNLSIAGTFQVTDTIEGESEESASCSRAEKYVSYKASEQCRRVGIAASKRTSDWARNKWSIDIPGHLYDFGYTKYFCKVTAEFKCVNE